MSLTRAKLGAQQVIHWLYWFGWAYALVSTAVNVGVAGAWILGFLLAQIALLRLPMARRLRSASPLLGLLAIEVPFSLLAFYLTGGPDSPASILPYFLIGLGASVLPVRELIGYTAGLAIAFLLPLVPPLLPSGETVRWAYLVTGALGYSGLAYVLHYLILSEERERRERLESEQTLVESRRRVNELTALHRISRQLSSTLELDRLLPMIVEETVSAAPAASGALLLVDEHTGRLALRASYGYTREQLQAYEQLDFGQERTIVGAVAATGERAVVPDVSQDPNYYCMVPETQSELAVPIRLGQKVVGVLDLEAPVMDAFAEDDVRFLEAIADQAALALTNAQLYASTDQTLANRVEELSAMAEIARILTSTLDLDELLGKTLSKAADLVQAQSLALLLYDDAAEKLRGHPKGVVGLPPDEAATLSIDTRSAEFENSVFRTGQSFSSSNALEDRRIISAYRPLIEKFGLKTVLSVPLRTHDVMLGELHAGNKRNGAFTADDERLLTTIAAQLATGIQNVRLYQRTDEQLRNQVQQVTALQRITRELNATLELEQILNVVITEAIGATRSTHGNIALLDMDTGDFHTVATQGYTEDEGALLRETALGDGPSLTEEVIRSASPVLLRDVSTEERPVCVRSDTRSAMSVPILYEGRVAGVINLFATEPGVFDASTLEFIEGLANQAGVAIGNAWRYQEQVHLGRSLRRRAEQLNSLLEIGNALRMNLSLEEVLEQIGYSIQDAVGFNMALLSVVEGDPPYLRRVAASGMPLTVFEEMRQVRQPLERFERIMKEEYRISQSYFYPHQRASEWLEGLHVYTPSAGEEEWEEGRWHPEDMLIVPLHSSDGRIIGLLSVDEPRDGRVPGRQTIEVLEIFANQATVAIENAQLYQKQLEQSQLMTRRAEQLGNLLDFGNVLKAEMDLEQVCHQIVEAAHDQMGYRLVALNLVDSEDPALVRVAATAGLRNASGGELSALPFPRADIENLLQERFRISQSYLIPGNAEKVISQGGLPVYIPDLGERSVEEWQPTDVFIVPLTGSKGYIGFLSLDDPVSRKHPEPADVAALEIFANQAAIGIENALLYESLVTRMREISALYDVSRGLVSTLDFHSMLEDMLETLKQSAGYINCALLFLDSASNTLVTKAAVGYPEDIEGLRIRVGREGITGWVAENKQPLVVLDVTQDTRYLQKDASTRSEVAVPMMVGSRLIGVLDAQSDELDAFDERDLRILSAAAAQAAVAIENSRLYDETHRRATQLEATSEVGRRIASILDLDELLTEVVELAHESFNYDHVHVFLVDQATNEAVYRAGNGSTGRRICEEGLRLRVGEEGIIGHVASSAQPLIANDVAKDPHYVSHPALKGTRAECTVPLMIGGRVIGILDVQSDTANAFGDDDLFLLQTLGDQLAIGIENARLFEESDRRIRLLAALNKMGQAVSSTLDPTRLVEEIHKQISQVMDASNFYIALYDEGSRVVSFPYAVEMGERQQWEPMDAGTSLTEHVIRTGQPLFLPEKVMERVGALGITPVGQPALSWVGVPLTTGDKTIGVMTVQSYEKARAYTEEDLNLLQTIATQAATAFENARLFQETRQSAEEMRLLYDLGVALSETLDLDQVLTLIAQSALRLTRTSLATIYVREHPGADLIFKAMSNPPELGHDISLRKPRSHGLTAQILRSGELIVIEDTIADRRVSSAIKKVGIRSMIGIPIQVEGETVGVLFAGALEKRHFTTRQLQLVMFLVNQSARAIRNAQLYQEISRLNTELEQRVEQRTAELAEANRELTAERDRTEALYRIAKELSASLDLNRVMARALQLLREAIGMSQGSILLLDHETADLIHRASLDRSDQLPPGGKRTPFRAGKGFAGWILEHREPAILPDVTKDERWTALEGARKSVKSALAVPLQTGEDVLGVLTLTDARPDYFSEAHLKLVTAAATQIATAIGNAELYRLIQEQADRLGDMLRTQQTESSKNRAILEGIGDGVVVTDKEGRIILFNDAAERILGLPRSVVMGESVHALPATLASGAEMASKGLAAVSKWVGAATQGHRLSEERFSVGKNVANVRVTPVTAGDELLGTVALFRDVTKEVEAERVKNEFISTVSHELRTPMTSIKGYTDLLFMQAAGPITDNQRKFLTVIKSNADRLAMLVSDLLDISRIETGRIRLDRQPIAAEKVIHEVVAALGKQAEEKSLALSVKVKGTLPPVYADRDRLAQILTNLVDNACRYTPSGGKITVSARRVSDKVQVSVKDSGIGIRPEDQQRVFERFFRADHPLVQETGGTGLGLAIVKSFVEMHGGMLSLESEPDKGTTFTFTIPIAVLAEPLPQADVVEIAHPLRVGKRILVIEDEPDVAELIASYLREEGYEAVTCSRGREALKRIRKEGYDLVTLDVWLPDVDGLELLRELKADAELAEIPVIVLSVAEVADSAYRLGAADYLTKPLDKQRLLSVINSVLFSQELVLICDDDQDTQTLLRQVLERHGFVARTVSDGRQVLAVADKESPGLILLDLKMPGLDGYGVLEELKKTEKTRDIPVIVMTASVTENRIQKERLQALGARNLMTKPFSIDALLNEVRSALRSPVALEASAVQIETKDAGEN